MSGLHGYYGDGIILSAMRLRALARSPEQRPASAVEFRDALTGGLTTRASRAYAPLLKPAQKRPVALALVSLSLLSHTPGSCRFMVARTAHAGCSPACRDGQSTGSGHAAGHSAVRATAASR